MQQFMHRSLLLSAIFCRCIAALPWPKLHNRYLRFDLCYLILEICGLRRAAMV